MGLAERAQSEPERLGRFLAAPDLIRAVTPEDIHSIALRYLAPEAAVRFVVVPEAAAAP